MAGYTATDTDAFLTLGHVLTAIGAEHDPPITLDDVRVIRHSYNTGEPAGLRGAEDPTEERIREYTRCQGISPKSRWYLLGEREQLIGDSGLVTAFHWTRVRHRSRDHDVVPRGGQRAISQRGDGEDRREDVNSPLIDAPSDGD